MILKNKNDYPGKKTESANDLKFYTQLTGIGLCQIV
jgi:hypothetical protein